MFCRVLFLALAVGLLRLPAIAEETQGKYNGIIHVVATVVIEEKEDIEKFKKLAKVMMPDTRAEDANFSYELHQSIDDPHEFVFIETWGSPQGLSDHLNEGKFVAFFEKAKPLMRGKNVTSLKSYKRLFK